MVTFDFFKLIQKKDLEIIEGKKKVEKLRKQDLFKFKKFF